MSNRIFTLKTVQNIKLAFAAFDKYFKETLCTQCKVYMKNLSWQVKNFQLF